MSIPNEELTLPPLYALDSKGVVRVWQTWTILNEDGTATEHTKAGIEGGTLSGIPITILEGKNIGKKNETTPLQQANKNITSRHAKKMRKGYVLDLSEFTQQGVMAALKYEDASHRLPKQVIFQPKLDGIRAKVILGAETRLMSKHNKEFKPHLYELPWVRYIEENLERGQEVDGEMYYHGLELNEISRLVNSYKMDLEEFDEYCEFKDGGVQINLPKKAITDLVFTREFYPYLDDSNNIAGHEAVEIGRNKGYFFPGVTEDQIDIVGTNDLEYWVFDMPHETFPAEVRNAYVDENFSNEQAEDANLVAVVGTIGYKADLEDVNEDYLEQGFEGTMLRNPAGKYAFGNRTPDLQKFKLFYDAEWEIKGYSIDREGNPTLVFESETGAEFEVRPTGDRAWRARILRDMDSIIGKQATIRYQKLMKDSKIPQFARAIAIRDYE